MSEDCAVSGNAVKSTPNVGGGKRVCNSKPAFERRSLTRPQVVQRWQKTILTRGRQAPSMKTCKIDMWIARTESILKSQSTLKLLSAEDWSGFGRQRVPAARDNAIAARIMLRLGLSRAVDFRIVPTRWNFKRTAYGQLLLSNAINLHFSVSHAEDIVAVAVASGASLGLDLENADQHLSPLVIGNFLHPQERIALEALPHHQKVREFIRFWTIKEAYAKLVGLGHSIDFASLNCAGDSICAGNGRSACRSLLFENFYAPVGYSLYHASLAIKTNMPSAVSVEMQMMSVLAPGENRHLACAPICI